MDELQDEDTADDATAAGGATSSRSGALAAKVQLPPLDVAEAFDPGQWLCDGSISFAATCLAALGGTGAGAMWRNMPKTVSLLDPAMAYWLALQDNPRDVDEAKHELKFQDLDLVLCPINDSNDAGRADSGLHWTLLACWGRKPGGGLRNFRYYDSLRFGLMGEQVVPQAQLLANRFAAPAGSSFSGRVAHVRMGDCARQTNFFDCGVYVLLFSEIIIGVFVDSSERFSGGASPGSPRGVAGAPIWERRLRTVTPEEANACRAIYRDLATTGAVPGIL